MGQECWYTLALDSIGALQPSYIFTGYCHHHHIFPKGIFSCVWVKIKVVVKRNVTCYEFVGGHVWTRRGRWRRPLSPLFLNSSRRTGRHPAKPLEASAPTLSKLEINIFVGINWKNIWNIWGANHLWPFSTVFQAEVQEGSTWSSVPVFLVKNHRSL